jgi:cathepsin C
MLEARFRIKYKNILKNYFDDPQEFSISLQHVIDCSVYNQGCDGGYSYLTSKFFNQYDIFLDKCFNQISDNHSNGQKCHESKCKGTKFENLNLSVKDFYYVGGAYGLTNELNLMQDVYKNGPVVISFEPEYSFMIYKSGVYDFSSKNWFTKNMTKPKWQKVDHSVVLVGWGVEKVNGKDVKYWLIQNSWGTVWGDNGYAKFRRGIDLFGIESIGEGALPLIK